MENNEFTLEELTEFLLEISEKNRDDKRKFTIGTGKNGIIIYLEKLYRNLNYSEEKIKLALEEWNTSLKEGCYMIDSSKTDNFGITYYGINYGK